MTGPPSLEGAPLRRTGTRLCAKAGKDELGASDRTTSRGRNDFDVAIKAPPPLNESLGPPGSSRLGPCLHHPDRHRRAYPKLLRPRVPNAGRLSPRAFRVFLRPLGQPGLLAQLAGDYVRAHLISTRTASIWTTSSRARLLSWGATFLALARAVAIPSRLGPEVKGGALRPCLRVPLRHAP